MRSPDVLLAGGVLAMVVLLGHGASARRASDSRAAIERALPALQQSAMTFVAHRSCASCHHNILPILTLRLAASRGFAIDRTILESVERRTFSELTSARAFDDAVQGATVSDPNAQRQLAAHRGSRSGSGAESDERRPREADRELAARRPLVDVGFPSAALEQPVHGHSDRGSRDTRLSSRRDGSGARRRSRACATVAPGDTTGVDRRRCVSTARSRLGRRRARCGGGGSARTVETAEAGRRMGAAA
jgi:hypothetical protein